MTALFDEAKFARRFLGTLEQGSVLKCVPWMQSYPVTTGPG